jgi:hypothetical protein
MAKSEKKPAKPKTGERFPPVRDAGPDNMKNPPKDWDGVDQEEDESFPASDPHGDY